MIEVRTEIINYLLKPETISAIFGFLLSLPVTIPAIIKSINDAKGKNAAEKAFNVALIESEKAFVKGLNNEASRERVIGAIYSVLTPKEIEKYMPQEKAIEMSNMVYHTYIKPMIKKNEIDYLNKKD